MKVMRGPSMPNVGLAIPGWPLLDLHMMWYCRNGIAIQEQGKHRHPVHHVFAGNHCQNQPHTVFPDCCRHCEGGLAQLDCCRHCKGGLAQLGCSTIHWQKGQGGAWQAPLTHQSAEKRQLQYLPDIVWPLYVSTNFVAFFLAPCHEQRAASRRRALRAVVVTQINRHILVFSRLKV